MLRIALIDIETAPNLGWVWGMWEQNVIQFEKSWYMLSFSYKWLGEKRATTHALPDYPGYERAPENDKALVKELWAVLNEADIVIAHNGDKFDLKKSNARFIAHGLNPPSPYKSIDTLKIARRHFKFDSNKLDNLGAYLGVGRKVLHTGVRLWFGCMRGEPRSWRLMRRYNAGDVQLLERVYLKLRPWATGHPNLNNYTRAGACPTCQSSHTQRRGFYATKTGQRPRIQCMDCGAWSHGDPFKRVPTKH